MKPATEHTGTLQHFSDPNVKDTFHIDAQPTETVSVIGRGWAAVNPLKENDEMTKIVGVPVESFQEKLESKDTEIRQLEFQLKHMEQALKEYKDTTQRDERELKQFKAERRGQYALEVYRTVNATQNYNKQAEILTEAAVNVIIEQLKVHEDQPSEDENEEPEECCEGEASDPHEISLEDYRKKFSEEVSTVEYRHIAFKTTVAILILKNGFEIVGSSACVKPEDFNYNIGKMYAELDAYRKLDELIGFKSSY